MACTGCPALGVFTKILLEPGASPHTFDSSSAVLHCTENDGENIQQHQRIIGGQGITGKFYRLKSRKRLGGSLYYGRLSMNPGPGDFNNLLPYLVGTESTDVFTPTACLNKFGLLVDRDLGDAWEFKDGVVRRWSLYGRGADFNMNSTPDLLQLDIDMVFKDGARTAWPDPAPSTPTASQFAPYIFQDCDGAFTMVSSARDIYAFRLVYDRMLSIRAANSLTVNSICSLGSRLRLGVELPWNSSNTDLFGQAYTGSAAEIIFSLGSHSTEFDITNLTVPSEGPYTRGRREIWFENNGEGYGDASTDTPDLVVTNTIA